MSQLAAYLGQLSDTGAAANPTLVDGRQVVAFQAWVIETRSAGTGLNKYKALQQFFRWLVTEGEIVRPNGIKIRLRELGDKAGVEHAQRWRHSFAYEWKLAGGDTRDLMLLVGWTSEEMPRRYGASAAAERAQAVHARLGVGERV